MYNEALFKFARFMHVSSQINLYYTKKYLVYLVKFPGGCWFSSILMAEIVNVLYNVKCSVHPERRKD